MTHPHSARISGRFPQDTPYTAAMTRLTYESASGKRLPLSIWYPSRDQEKKRRDGIYDLSFARDGKPARGRFGVIMISHGSGGSDINHHDWAEHLARNGYVVGAVRHLGDSHDQQRGLASREQLLDRPRQLKKGLDVVLSHPALKECIDPGRVGALGFSAGGYTVLTLLGAVPDYSRWKLYCQANPDPTAVCPLGDDTDPASPGDADWGKIYDPRIKAAVLMAPFAMLFEPQTLAKITVPLRIYRAEDESITKNPWNADSVAKNASGPVDVVTTPGDHYVFIAPVKEALRRKYPEFYQDAPGIYRDALHVEIGKSLQVFFNTALEARHD
jgi:Predicted dienelactone hydrolase